MSTSPKEEPITYENVLRLIKQQTVELRAQWEEQAAIERKQREEQAAAQEEKLRKEEEERKKRDAEFEKWKKEMRSQIGGIGRSNGAYAEQFFIRAMKHSKSFGNIEYNQVSSNWNAHNERFDEEYDVILHNCDSLVLIEIKYKFAMEDFTAFIGRKLTHFREYYTMYSDKKLYLGIAGFSFEDGVVESAKKHGIGILHKDGRNVEYDDANLKEF